jgi:hypothetical protein
MGLKNWLAKNVAGVSGYGQTFGRENVTNGLALGRTLYLGHGSRASAPGVLVLRDEDQMKAQGFSLHCPDPSNMAAAEDDSELSKQTRALGIAFAAQCSMTAASNFMKRENAGAFFRSLGEGTRAAMNELRLPVTSEMIDYYINQPPREGVTQVLDLENPGVNDVLSGYLQAIKGNTSAIAFRQSGAMGFDLIAAPLVQEIIIGIGKAAKNFGW